MSVWEQPPRIKAHRLLRTGASLLLPVSDAPQAEMVTRTVEEIFHAGLLAEAILGPPNEVNTRIDRFFDRFRDLPLFDLPPDLPAWERFGAEANYRRSVAASFLGQRLQEARAFLSTEPGRFLVRALPFENRERKNDAYELLYFRDSGIHRRLMERAPVTTRKADGVVDHEREESRRAARLERYVPKRWEAFVVTTILDLVGVRCEAFAYRHEETREIDLILEWLDRTPVERWAIEVASRKFNTHPGDYFAEECDYLGVSNQNYLGVSNQNRFVVRRANDCDGGAKGRGGVAAISLPLMVQFLERRLGI